MSLPTSVISWVACRMGNAGIESYFSMELMEPALFLRPFSRSHQELHVEYQVDVLFMNIFRQNDVNRGQDLEI